MTELSAHPVLQSETRLYVSMILQAWAAEEIQGLFPVSPVGVDIFFVMRIGLVGIVLGSVKGGVSMDVITRNDSCARNAILKFIK